MQEIPAKALAFRRLEAGDRELARKTFALMAEVFEEPREALPDDYIDALLQNSVFWIVAAFDDEAVVGGVTAHAIPMTRVPASELFIYDLAVRADARRRGVGRGLLAELRRCAASEGIRLAFVAADNGDEAALDFYRALDASAQPVTIFDFEW